MKSVLKWVGIGFVGLVVLGAIVGGTETKTEPKAKAAAPVADEVAAKGDTAAIDKAAAQVEAALGGTAEKAEAKPKPKPPAQPKPEAPAQPAEPELTSGQENAVESAQTYIDMSGFSREGLIQQLSSSAGEGFSRADATFAADHVDVNWNDEAVESARGYLDMSSFSRQGLIQQLTSSAGDKYTLAQAQYAVSRVY